MSLTIKVSLIISQRVLFPVGDTCFGYLCYTSGVWIEAFITGSTLLKRQFVSVMTFICKETCAITQTIYCQPWGFSLSITKIHFSIHHCSDNIRFSPEWHSAISSLREIRNWKDKGIVHPKIKITLWFARTQSILGVDGFLLLGEHSRSYMKK